VNYRINLLPEELWPHPPLDRRRLVVIAVVTLAAGLVLGWGGGWLALFWRQKAELAVVSAELAYLKPAVQRYDAERADEQRYLNDTRIIQGLLARRRYWKPVLDQIAATLPVDTWLDSIDISSGKGEKPAGTLSPQGGSTVPPEPDLLVVTGRARSFSSVGVLEKNLALIRPGGPGVTRPSGLLFQKVTLDAIKEKDGGVWSFTLTCYLNPA